MVIGAKTRLALDWFFLSAITVISWWIGSRHGYQVFTINALITFSVIGIAGVKVRVIFTEFMEARNAPAVLRRIIDTWLALLVLTLLAIYTVGVGLHA